MKELSEKAYVLLKAIGDQCEKEQGKRNDIESRSLFMGRTEFLSVVQELNEKCFLNNGSYDTIFEGSCESTDRQNVILRNPSLTAAGKEAFYKLKM